MGLVDGPDRSGMILKALRTRYALGSGENDFHSGKPYVK